MAYLMEVPLETGGELLVQATAEELPDGLELSTRHPGDVVARSRESLERSLDHLGPLVNAVHERLTTMSPDETTVEFGVLLGAESGVILAKGTAEVHFTIKLSWRGGDRPGPRPGNSGVTSTDG